MAFTGDLDPASPTPVTVEGVDLVLFRDDNQRWVALADRCPHRSARLSDGRVVDGTIECLYHGWRFGGEGACVHVPQLPEGASIPAAAHTAAAAARVIDSVLWLGPPGDAAAPPPASIVALGGDDVHRIDFVMDLPYPHDALIENVLDFAHIHIAHDGVRGGGHRDAAGPLAFDIEARGERGFRARFLSPPKTSPHAGPGAQPAAEGATVAFHAPSLVHYESTSQNRDRVAGLALYAVPIDATRCRLLYRAYGNHWPDRDRTRPRWREHLHQMRLLEQDMAVVSGQVATIQRDGRPLREQWLALKSSDPLVLAYRQWVDAFPGAAGRSTSPVPGWATAQDPQGAREPLRSGGPRDLSRWTLHTRHCADCRRALQAHRRREKLATGAALGVALASAVLPWPWSAPAMALAGLSIWLRRDSQRIAESLELPTSS